MKTKHTKFTANNKYFKPGSHNGSEYSKNQDKYNKLSDPVKALHLNMIIKHYGVETLNDKELSEACRLGLIEHDNIEANKASSFGSEFAEFITKLLLAQSILELNVEKVDAFGLTVGHPPIALPNGGCLTIATWQGIPFHKDLTYTKCWDKPCNDTSVDTRVDYTEQERHNELSMARYNKPSYYPYKGTKIVDSNAVEVVVSGREFIHATYKKTIECGAKLLLTTTEQPTTTTQNSANKSESQDIEQGSNSWIVEIASVLSVGSVLIGGIISWLKCKGRSEISSDPKDQDVELAQAALKSHEIDEESLHQYSDNNSVTAHLPSLEDLNTEPLLVEAGGQVLQYSEVL